MTLRSVGATTLRVHVQRLDEGTVSLSVADATGEPAATIEALSSRPVSAEQLRATTGSLHDPMLWVDWTEVPLASSPTPTGSWAVLGADLGAALAPPVRYKDLQALQEALDQGASAPALVLAPLSTLSTQDLPPSAHQATAHALALLQGWMADERLASTRLVLLTRGAVATRPDEDVRDLAHAPVWGLVRSAQNENPFLSLFLVDSDDPNASLLPLFAALEGDDRQLALRSGRCLAPRLARLVQVSAKTDRPLDPQGTVLVTGGTGTLGALLARHLVAQHGAKHLL